MLINLCYSEIKNQIESHFIFLEEKRISAKINQIFFNILNKMYCLNLVSPCNIMCFIPANYAAVSKLFRAR